MNKFLAEAATVNMLVKVMPDTPGNCCRTPVGAADTFLPAPLELDHSPQLMEEPGQMLTAVIGCRDSPYGSSPKYRDHRDLGLQVC